MKRTFATVVWLSATMNVPDATAVQHGDRELGPAHRRERPDDAAALGDGDEREQCERREDRPPGDLGRGAHRQLPLEHARARPRERRERDVHLAAASDDAGVDDRRRDHTRSQPLD